MTSPPKNIKQAWLRLLFTVRRTLRHRVAAQDEMYRLAQALEREAKKLEAAPLLNEFAIKGLRKTAEVMRTEFNAMYPRSLKEYGKIIMDMAPWIDHVTTLQERCEALNVNIADRSELTEKDGIIEIIFAHALEDSGTYRGCDDNGDKPLFRAVHRAFMGVMLSTPEGRAAADQALEDVFDIAFPIPGERPSDVPGPSIHDPCGQSAIERKPTLH